MFAGITLPWPWAYPALEVLHIIGIGLLLGNLVLLELRVFGRGAALPVPELARLSLTLVAMGFALICVLLIAGSLNFQDIVHSQAQGRFAQMGLGFLSWNWLPLLVEEFAGASNP